MSETDEPSAHGVELLLPKEQVANHPTERSGLWDLLDAVEMAKQVSVGLARRLREIATQQIVDSPAPCAHPYCRYKVLVVDGVAEHIDPNGVPFGSTIELPMPADDGSFHSVAHEASPADERHQAELLAIVDSAVPCAHPHCDRNVAVIDGGLQHIDHAGKLLGRHLSVPVPIEGGGHKWVPHHACPALDVKPSHGPRDNPNTVDGGMT